VVHAGAAAGRRQAVQRSDGAHVVHPDRWQPWLAVAVILIVVAYGPTLVRLAVTTPLTTPGLRVW
jgi:hypothetical protein